MIQVSSAYSLAEMEGAITRAVQRQGAHILAVTHLGQLLEAERPGRDALVFTLCYLELYRALLAADIRFACLLPLRVAAVEQGGQVIFEAISPRGFAQSIGRADLERLVAPLESMLSELASTISQRAGAAPSHGHPPGHHALGATEEQVNLRGSVPQRIDCHGTKVEDLAGVGGHDAAGG